MSDIAKFVKQVRQRELDNYERDIGNARCFYCGDWTDEVDADDQPACPACKAENDSANRREDLHNGRR